MDDAYRGRRSYLRFPPAPPASSITSELADRARLDRCHTATWASRRRRSDDCVLLLRAGAEPPSGLSQTGTPPWQRDRIPPSGRRRDLLHLERHWRAHLERPPDSRWSWYSNLDAAWQLARLAAGWLRGLGHHHRLSAIEQQRRRTPVAP